MACSGLPFCFLSALFFMFYTTDICIPRSLSDIFSSTFFTLYFVCCSCLSRFSIFTLSSTHHLSCRVSTFFFWKLDFCSLLFFLGSLPLQSWPSHSLLLLHTFFSIPLLKVISVHESSLNKTRSNLKSLIQSSFTLEMSYMRPGDFKNCLGKVKKESVQVYRGKNSKVINLYSKNKKIQTRSVCWTHQIYGIMALGKFVFLKICVKNRFLWLFFADFQVFQENSKKKGTNNVLDRFLRVDKVCLYIVQGWFLSDLK